MNSLSAKINLKKIIKANADMGWSHGGISFDSCIFIPSIITSSGWKLFFFETKAVTIQVAHFLIFESRGNGKLIKSDKLLESE